MGLVAGIAGLRKKKRCAAASAGMRHTQAAVPVISFLFTGKGVEWSALQDCRN